ncbi:TetR/AcrR family transcriptional regulator [Lentzea aerocolonigenes]|uniref:TetR/AcrR family transcriptional regulator n=1 Tax=Lentzea aerocolonigenes TaxID=68170 RepID=UPI000AF5C0B9|nr:TetR/AcrR family transcriptional regulator [Lentzea aerocolonigenes]
MVTKRRIETRQRLLESALAVFAEEGFGRSTVEQVCARAGYSRGAFYSNFETLDELFLAVWEQRSAELISRMREAFEDFRHDAAADVDDVVAHLLRAVPMDEEWFRVSAEFTAHALRYPELRQVIVERERAIAASTAPFLLAALAGIGRTAPDPGALGQALVAVHDGTALQCLSEPGNPEPWRRRAALFSHVITAYSVESKEQS